jgi:hypothetical protein
MEMPAHFRIEMDSDLLPPLVIQEFNEVAAKLALGSELVGFGPQSHAVVIRTPDRSLNCAIVLFQSNYVAVREVVSAALEGVVSCELHQPISAQ